MTVLNEGAAHLNDVGVLRAVGRDELGHHGEGLPCVDLHVHAIKVMDTSAVRVQVATVLVADTVVAKVIITALLSGATSVLTLIVAGVQCIGG